MIEQVNIKNKENKEERIKKYKCLFIKSNIYNYLIYLLISICRYLSMPDDGVDIITERKIFWSKDIIMTIIRLLLIPMSISKIIINLNILKKNLFLFLIYVRAGVNKNYIGGLITIPAFFIPLFLYKYYYNFETKNC